MSKVEHPIVVSIFLFVKVPSPNLPCSLSPHAPKDPSLPRDKVWNAPAK